MRTRLRSSLGVTAFFVLGGTLLMPSAATAGALNAPSGTVAPLSASGCNSSVCINVQGSGSEVSDWETTAWASTYVCTQANYWADYVLVHQGSTQCVRAGTELVSDWRNLSFPNGTVLCNTWPGIAGEPCETIES
jgi:hypothetical protein